MWQKAGAAIMNLARDCSHRRVCCGVSSTSAIGSSVAFFRSSIVTLQGRLKAKVEPLYGVVGVAADGGAQRHRPGCGEKGRLEHDLPRAVLDQLGDELFSCVIAVVLVQHDLEDKHYVLTR